MDMLKTTFAFFLLTCSSGFASTFTYNVAVNTGSLVNTTGTLYFQFNPGDITSDVATATVSNFQVPGGSLTGAPLVSPGVTFGGGAITIPNTGANNDALQAIAFGTSLAFRVTLADTFTGTAATGSVFNFGVFQDDGVTPLLTNQIDGYSVIIDLDTANGATAQSTTAAATVVSAIPEPSTMLLLAAGCASFAALRFRRLER